MEGGGGGGAEHCFDMFRFESLEGIQSSYEHGVGLWAWLLNGDFGTSEGHPRGFEVRVKYSDVVALVEGITFNTNFLTFHMNQPFMSLE